MENCCRFQLRQFDPTFFFVRYNGVCVPNIAAEELEHPNSIADFI